MVVCLEEFEAGKQRAYGRSSADGRGNGVRARACPFPERALPAAARVRRAAYMPNSGRPREERRRWRKEASSSEGRYAQMS